MGGRGMTVRIRYVQSFADRHGQARYYFRKAGLPRVPLPGEPGSPEFMAAYNAAMAAAPPPMARRVIQQDGTVGALVLAYLGSVNFKRTRPSSQTVTRRILERFAASHGHRLVAEMRRKHVETILAGMSETPAAANNLLRRLRIVINFAIANDEMTADPTKGIPFYREGTHHTWTDDELARFEAYWPPGSRPRTAYALALYSGQRLSDVAHMTWRDYDAEAGTIRVKQQKTGVELILPVHPELRLALAAWPVNHVAILANARGQGTSAHGLGWTMAAAIEKAGLPPRCVFHGLRKAAARRLAEAGCSTLQIMAITGHKTMTEVERYTRAATQAPMARDAIARLSLSTRPGRVD